MIVEAMAAGVPVVGSDAGRIPDTVGDAGLIFHEGDAAGLRQGTRFTAHDPARREELREKGLARVRNNYSHEVLMGRTVRFYEEVLMAAGRARGGQTESAAEVRSAGSQER